MVAWCGMGVRSLYVLLFLLRRSTTNRTWEGSCFGTQNMVEACCDVEGYILPAERSSSSFSLRALWYFGGMGKTGGLMILFSSMSRMEWLISRRGGSLLGFVKGKTSGNSSKM